MKNIELNKRQQRIIEIVKENQPITSENIASILNVTRSTLRSDLAILTMTGILDARPKVGYFYLGEANIGILGENIKNKKAQDIMSSPIIIKKDISIYDTIVKIFLEDVGSIFIVDDNDELCGVVSRKDLLKATIGGSDINKMPVGMIMTRTPNVITIDKNESITVAVKKIIDHQVDSMPVVQVSEDNSNKINVVGRISKTNITKLFLQLIGG